MSRPNKLPSWCDDDAASKVVEPSGAKKLQGWIYQERPAFQFWNWVFRNFVKWILHLDVSANQFDTSQASTPNMTVVISAGRIQDGITITTIAQQITSAFTAPSGNPRIDRIVIDGTTGVYSVIAGTEAASPVAPSLTARKISIAKILLQTSTISITSSMITDERAFVVSPYIKSHGGHVNSAGVMQVQSGNITSSKVTTGQYTITHNFNSLNYAPIVNHASPFNYILKVFNKGLNSFDVLSQDTSGTNQDGDFTFNIQQW